MYQFQITNKKAVVDMEKDEDKGQERRSFNRIKYNFKNRPKLYTKSDIFDVVEITEKDLWLTSNNKTHLNKKIQGVLTFLNGESLDMEGIVIWKEDNYFGLKFENLKSSDMLLKELRHLMRCD